MPIDYDKFYTPFNISKHCIDKTFDILKGCFISEIIEPSAGSGSFSLQLPNCIAFDIQPEHETVLKQDFLKIETPYKKGRLIIGNPPFGERNNMSRAFYKKSIKIADYIAFIQPISQLNNTHSMYEFDLIYSEDLNIVSYSDVKLHCCFNIYKRPLNGLNKKPNNPIKNLFKIYRSDHKNYANIKEDFEIIRRGGRAGKLANGHLDCFKIVVSNKKDLEFIKNTILNFDFSENKKYMTALSLKQHDIYNLFAEKEIKNSEIF
jgi:hypothetical protein